MTNVKIPWLVTKVSLWRRRRTYGTIRLSRCAAGKKKKLQQCQTQPAAGKNVWFSKNRIYIMQIVYICQYTLSVKRQWKSVFMKDYDNNYDIIISRHSFQLKKMDSWFLFSEGKVVLTSIIECQQHCWIAYNIATLQHCLGMLNNFFSVNGQKAQK